jgi:hypothetical protein
MQSVAKLCIFNCVTGCARLAVPGATVNPGPSQLIALFPRDKVAIATTGSVSLCVRLKTDGFYGT